jgi:hypothetical protein
MDLNDIWYIIYKFTMKYNTIQYDTIQYNNILKIIIIYYYGKIKIKFIDWVS